MARQTSLSVTRRAEVAVLRLDRPAKRNAIHDALLRELEAFFDRPPPSTRAVVLHGAGEHFCAGLDLSEHRLRTPPEAMRHSQWWQRVFERIQLGGLPVVAALHGGVIGGGVELAMTAHVRVAAPSTYFQLPEAQRGIFVGGGASVRVARAIGTGRMTEMMLTGRAVGAEEGVRIGLAHYLVDEKKALEAALALARRIAANAPMSNWAAISALAHIEDMGTSAGYFAESMATALAQGAPEARRGMRAFLRRRARRA